MKHKKIKSKLIKFNTELELLDYRIQKNEDRLKKSIYTIEFLKAWLIWLIVLCFVTAGIVFYHHEKFGF